MLAGGAIAAGVVVFLALVLIPFARRWDDRREAIEANRDRVQRYAALLRGEKGLRLEVAARRRSPLAGRLLSGMTPAVAASNLQSLLQEYARSSGITPDRVDVVGEAKVSDEGLAGVPVQLTAHGDIHGLVALLQRIDGGEKLLLVDELTVARGVTRADSVDVLSFTLRLRGAWAAPAGGGT